MEENKDDFVIINNDNSLYSPKKLLDVEFLTEEFNKIYKDDKLKELSSVYDSYLLEYRQSKSYQNNKNTSSLLHTQMQMIQNNLKEYAINQLSPQSRKDLIDKIKSRNPHLYLSDNDAIEIFRRSLILYLGTRFTESIKRKFTIVNQQTGNPTTYISIQTPIQPFNNCYARWKPGLPSLRAHVLIKRDEFEKETVLISNFPHGSPVPYEISNFEDWVNITVENFHALEAAIKAHAGLSDNAHIAITEIRLLSTAQKIDGKQILVTYLAALKCDCEITLFNFGVNFFRKAQTVSFIEDKLDIFINTRSMNILFEKTLDFLEITMEKSLSVHTDIRDLFMSIQEIKKKREDIKKNIRSLDLSKGEKHISHAFMDLLNDYHQQEEALLESFKLVWKIIFNYFSKSWTEDQQLMANRLQALLKLLDTNIHTKSIYNGQIQNVIMQIMYMMGEFVAGGCNDAKDRAALVFGIGDEANEIFYDENARYPYEFNGNKAEEDKTGDRQRMRQIQREVFTHSTATKAAEIVSVPEIAKNIEHASTNQPGSGYKHLDNEFSLAGIFKIDGMFGHTPSKNSLSFSFNLEKNIINYLESLSREDFNAALIEINNSSILADIKNNIQRYFNQNKIEIQDNVFLLKTHGFFVQNNGRDGRFNSIDTSQPMYYEFNTEQGINIYYYNAEEAKTIYGCIPEKCKKFMTLKTGDNIGSNMIQIEISKGKGTEGVYIGNVGGEIAITFPDEFSQDTCLKLFGFDNRRFIKNQAHTTIYFLNNLFFKAINSEYYFQKAHNQINHLFSIKNLSELSPYNRLVDIKQDLEIIASKGNDSLNNFIESIKKTALENNLHFGADIPYIKEIKDINLCICTYFLSLVKNTVNSALQDSKSASKKYFPGISHSSHKNVPGLLNALTNIKAEDFSDLLRQIFQILLNAHNEVILGNNKKIFKTKESKTAEGLKKIIGILSEKYPQELPCYVNKNGTLTAGKPPESAPAHTHSDLKKMSFMGM